MKRVVILASLIVLNCFFVAGLEKGICLDAEVASINPSSITVNEEFTVGIVIDNCGEQISDDVVFEIKDISPYISVKEPLVQRIGRIGYANSDRFINYHFKSSEDAVPGIYSFRYELSYGSENYTVREDGNFSVTLIADKAKINLASVKTNPVLPYLGDTVELTIRIENYGRGSANSLKVSAEHPFLGTKEAFLGTLDSEEDAPAVFTFITDKAGEFEFPIKISYADDYGENMIEKKVKITILEKEINYLFIVSSAIIILVFLLIIFVLWRKNNKKDKVIRQILSKRDGENIQKKLK